MVSVKRKAGADTTTQNNPAIVISTPALLSLSVKLVSADYFYFSGKHTLRLFPPMRLNIFALFSLISCRRNQLGNFRVWQFNFLACGFYDEKYVPVDQLCSAEQAVILGSYFQLLWFAHNPTSVLYFFFFKIQNPCRSIGL